MHNQPLIYRDSLGLFPSQQVLQNPAFLPAAGAALSTLGGALAATGGAIASSPAAVAVGGLALGYGIGYYPGQYTANHPSNPFVNGPLNPFGTPYSAKPPNVRPVPFPNQSEKCGAKPLVLPYHIDIPWEPQSYPDRDGCAEEISDCTVWCSEAKGNPNLTKKTRGWDFDSCMQGCVSERCKKGTWLGK